MKYASLIFCLMLVSFLAFSPLSVLAESTGGASVQKSIQDNLEGVGANAGYKTGTGEAGLPAIIGKIINVFLSILGVLFVILMIYGGYSWMTSYGNEQKVTKAKTLITDAIIGLIIILVAYALANFIVGQLVKTTTV